MEANAAMLIKTLPVGQLETNCYIVTDETSHACVIIDPGAESSTILDYIESNKLNPEAIFLTHGHFDHIMALEAILETIGAPAYINDRDINKNGGRGQLKLNDNAGIHRYSEGDIIIVSGLEFIVMETPGHSPGSVTLKCDRVLFTGDTLFRDGCGRTDLGGNAGELTESLKRLASLEGDYEVYPGHAGSTTMQRERSFNYYMKHAVGEKLEK